MPGLRTGKKKKLSFNQIKANIEARKKVEFNAGINFDDNPKVPGSFSGTLVNYKHKKLAHGWYKFAVHSLKSNDGKILHLLYMHKGSLVPIGTLIGYSDENGFHVEGQLNLNLHKNGNPKIQAAHEAYSHAMDMGAKYEMSVGGWITEKTYKTSKTENNGQMYVEISDFDAYEGSLVLRGAVEGSEVTEIFGEDIEAEEPQNNTDQGEETGMDAEQIKAMTAAIIAGLMEAQQANDNTAFKVELDKFEKFKTDMEAKFTETEKMEKEFGELKAQIKTYDELIAKLTAPGAGGSEAAFQEDYDKYNKYLHNEFALDTTTGAALIPKALSNAMSKDMKEVGNFYGDAGKIKAKGTTIRVPVRKPNTTSSAKTKAEGAAPAEGGTNLSEIELGKGVIQSTIPLTDEMRRDSQFDAAGIVREYSVEDITEDIETRIVSGDLGTANNKYEGFTVNTAFIGRANESAVVDKIDSDDLQKTKAEVKPQYWAKCKWYVSKNAWLKMKTMKDSTGQPLWRTGLIAGAPDTFDGHPVKMQWQMTDEYPVLFGDFKKLYYIFEDYQMETEKARHAEAGYTNEIVRHRSGGKVANIQAGCLLKNKTA